MTVKNIMKKKNLQTGWATLEMVLLLPLIVGLIGVLFYFSQLAFLQLHLTSVTDAATRIAAIRGCDSGKKFVTDSFTSPTDQLQIDCGGDDYITINVSMKYKSSMPFFDSIERTITVKSSALNEKKLADQQASS